MTAYRSRLLRVVDELRAARAKAQERAILFDLQRRGLRIDLGVHFETDEDTLFRFGDSCTVRPGSVLALRRGELTLGDRVLVGEFANLRPWLSHIRLGDDVLIAQHVSIFATSHQISARDGVRWWESDVSEGHHGVIVGENCWLAANSVLLPGVELGERCVVAAGAVVPRGVYQARTLLAGVPARPHALPDTTGA